MPLTKVTITGADDKTLLSDLISLSAEFPFVEWGILLSARHAWTPRFPGTGWIDSFTAFAKLHRMQVSAHLCGRWVRDLLLGELNWKSLPSVVEMAQRVQINTHAEAHTSSVNFVHILEAGRLMMPTQERQFIFQWDGVNDHLTFAAKAYDLDVAALFDTSGGAGRLPGVWPMAIPDLECGYAGGLSPDNVASQIELIEERCKQPYWIDMERRVRSDDDSYLDIHKVHTVLERCQPYIK